MQSPMEEISYMQLAEQISDHPNDPFAGFNKRYFGFFHPYTELKGPSGLGNDLARPIVGPLVLGLVTSVAAIGIVLGTITAATSLLFASGASLAGLFMDDAKQIANKAFMITAGAAIIAATCAALSIAVVLFAAIAIPLSIARIVTRSAATAVSAVSNCFAKSENQIQEDDEDGFSMSFDPVYPAPTII